MAGVLAAQVRPPHQLGGAHRHGALYSIAPCAPRRTVSSTPWPFAAAPGGTHCSFTATGATRRTVMNNAGLRIGRVTSLCLKVSLWAQHIANTRWRAPGSCKRMIYAEGKTGGVSPPTSRKKAAPEEPAVHTKCGMEVFYGETREGFLRRRPRRRLRLRSRRDQQAWYGAGEGI